MKSAVELVLSVKSRDDGKENDIRVLREENEKLRGQITRKDDQISELEDKLAVTLNSFTEELESTRTKHENETKASEAAYTGFVQNLVKNHRREMDDLRRSMKTAQNVHKTFIDSYVEASLDCLQRSSCDSPTL
jgi:predicted  nucleic acid-binding Zn-ribbon protein